MVVTLLKMMLVAMVVCVLNVKHVEALVGAAMVVVVIEAAAAAAALL